MQLGSRRREAEGQLLGSLSAGAVLICQAPLQLLSMLKSEMGAKTAQVPLTLKLVFCLPVPSLQVRRCKKEQLVWLERRLRRREQVVQFLTTEFCKSQPKNENIKTARSN